MPIAISGREGPLAGYRHGTWHFQARSSGRDGVRPVLGEAEIAGHGFPLLRFRSGRRLLIEPHEASAATPQLRPVNFAIVEFLRRGRCFPD